MIFRLIAGAVAILAAALVSAVTIAFLLPPVQQEGPIDELVRFVNTMPAISVLEMCEVWTQDQAAVIDRMQVLSYDINPGVIRAVVSQVCGGAG